MNLPTGACNKLSPGPLGLYRVIDILPCILIIDKNGMDIPLIIDQVGQNCETAIVAFIKLMFSILDETHKCGAQTQKRQTASWRSNRNTNQNEVEH